MDSESRPSADRLVVADDHGVRNVDVDSVDRDALATVYHSLLHQLALIASNVESALTATSNLQVDDTVLQVRSSLESARYAAECQISDALNYLSFRFPDSVVGALRSAQFRASPTAILLDMLPLYVAAAERRRVSLDVRINDDAPAIRVELGAVRRMFHNVITNAIKYSYHSGAGGNRSIRVWSRRHDATGNVWCISVQNYGIGIDADEAQSVFVPGFRGRRALREGVPGSGLGLADVRRAIRRHGGDAQIQSRWLHGDVYLTTVDLLFDIRRGFPA